MNKVREDFYQALEDTPDKHAIIVAVKLPSGAIEIITNTQDLDSKVNYYINNYDSDFKLKANPNVEIIGTMVV